MAVSVTEFQLDEFGGGNPLQVVDLGSGLNVALVHSHASRAQLLQVLPWTLYGPGPYFREADGSVIAPGTGAQATLGTDHGVFTIERDWRTWDGSAERVDEDDATPLVTAGDGETCAPEYLDHILERLPANTYREVFTFELDRLRRIVRSEAFGRDRLTRLANYLLRKSPHPTTANAASSGLEYFQNRLGELTAMIEARAASLLPDEGEGHAGDHGIDPERLQRELKKLDDDLLEVQNKIKHVEAEKGETLCAMELSPVESRLRDVKRELAQGKPSKSKGEPTSDSSAADRLEERIEAVREELRELGIERNELKRQGKELGDLKRVQVLVPQIDAILMQEKSLIREETAIEQMKAQLQDLEARAEAERLQATSKQHHRTTGSAWSGSVTANRIDAFAERFREIERELRLDEERLKRAESTGNATADHLARASAFASHPEDAVAIHEAEQRLLSLRELSGTDEQLHRLEEERDDLRSKMQRLYARQLMPFPMVMAIGVPFMVGVAMIIYGLIMTQGRTNWQFVILGFAATILSALIKTSLDRGSTDLLHATRRRLSRVEYQMDEIASANEATNSGGVSLARQIEQAERDLAKLQMRFASRESQSSTSPELTRGMSSLESARIQLNDARRREQELEQQWRETMIEMDLSPNLTTEHAREILAERAAHARPDVDESPIRNFEFQIEQLLGDIQRRQDWLATLMGQAKQLCKDLGHPVSGANVIELMDILREAIREHKDRMQTRRQLLRSIQRLRQKQSRVKENGRRFSEQRRQWDDDLRLKKSQRKQEQQLRQEQTRLLEKQRERFERELADIKQRHGISQQPLTDLDDEELQSRLENLQNRLSRYHDRVLTLSEQRGRCRGLLSLTSNGESGADDLAKGDAWLHVLEAARQLQESCEEQSSLAPVVSSGPTLYLTQASEYLRQLSAAQFGEITVTVDGQLRIVDHQGQSLGLDDIRREHNANIYFSLWLARIEAYASRGLRLPIVMEDPLEATDPTRRPLVAQLLAKFASRGHQVVLVTSNAANAELFSRWNVPIADFSDREIQVDIAPVEPTTTALPSTPPWDERESYAFAPPTDVAAERTSDRYDDDSHEPLFPRFDVQ